MRKILSFLVVFCLLLAVSASGDFRKSGFTGGLEKSLKSAFFGNDTIPIIHETFYNNLAGWTEVGGVQAWNVSYGKTYVDEDFDTGSLAGWTEVGGVDLIVHPTNSVVTDSVLEVTVSGGGSDYILRTITERNEYWYSCRFYLTDADTNDWGVNEKLRIMRLEENGSINGITQLCVGNVSGTLKWLLYRRDDAGSATFTTSSTEIVTDTWYSLLWHVKKSTAVGADNSINNLMVDGVEVLSVTTWDNDAVTYDRLYVGDEANTLGCIYYIDLVLLQGEPNPGLEVRVVGGGDDYIQKTIVSTNEYGWRIKVRFSDADTSEWDVNEFLRICGIRNSETINGLSRLGVKRVGSSLKWAIHYFDDAGSATTSVSTATLSTDTWHSLVYHVKKSTAVGADNGICNLSVDGVADIINVTNWDNDATVYNTYRAGEYSSVLNAIYYIDDVKLWSPEGLP